MGMHREAEAIEQQVKAKQNTGGQMTGQMIPGNDELLAINITHFFLYITIFLHISTYFPPFQMFLFLFEINLIIKQVLLKLQMVQQQRQLQEQLVLKISVPNGLNIIDG